MLNKYLSKSYPKKILLKKSAIPSAGCGHVCIMKISYDFSNSKKKNRYMRKKNGKTIKKKTKIVKKSDKNLFKELINVRKRIPVHVSHSEQLRRFFRYKGKNSVKYLFKLSMIKFLFLKKKKRNLTIFEQQLLKLKKDLQKITHYKNIEFLFTTAKTNTFTVDMMHKYVMRKIKYKHALRAIINPLIRQVWYNTYINGIMIRCMGRFTRRQRASYEKHLIGRVPLSKVTSSVHYKHFFVIKRYGLGSIKIWMNLSK